MSNLMDGALGASSASLPFIFAAAIMAVLAVCWLLRPWWPRAGKSPHAPHVPVGQEGGDAAAKTAENAPARRVASADFLGADYVATLNASIHRDRLAELELDYAQGAIAAADYAEARDELARQLLDDTVIDAAASGLVDESATGPDAPVERKAARPAAKTMRREALWLAIFLPLLAVGIYFFIGTPAALTEHARQTQQEAEAAAALAKVNGLIAQLEKKMQDNPNNPEGWAMLARGYKLLGRWDDAAKALARVGPGLDQDANLLTELAEVLAQKNHSFAGRASELIAQAQKLAPDNEQVLYLAGAAAYEQKQYAAAEKDWQHLLKKMNPQSEEAQLLAAGIAKAREMQGMAGGAALAQVGAGAQPGAPGQAASAEGNATAAAKAALSGRVTLSAALSAQAAPDDTVFIFARAVNGSRMPLAVQRARVADLPLDFHLDDSQAMAPGNKISAAESLRVEARISKSGQAMPESGDLTGSSSAVKPGTRNMQVVIDQVVK
jgi:cytochrome c-type biogenesis protein CcmH